MIWNDDTSGTTNNDRNGVVPKTSSVDPTLDVVRQLQSPYWRSRSIGRQTDR